MVNETRWQGDPTPVVERAQGVYLWDIEGRCMIDGNSGLQNVHIGHGREEMAVAAGEQIRRLDYFPVFGSSHVVAEELAAVLHRRLPHHERFYFLNSGSEAMDVAIKLIREYWVHRDEPDRTVIIARHGSYHGGTLGALSATGQPQLREPFSPLLLECARLTDPVARSGESEHEAVRRLADELEATIAQVGAGRILAMIAEPIQLWGVPVPPPSYWAAMSRICRAHDIPLVADEIITGFGRTGRWFGMDHWNVNADVVVLGKGLASGYAPISAVGVSAGICAGFDARGERLFHHVSTTSAHPLACALVLENLRILEDEALIERAESSGVALRRMLSDAFGDRPYAGAVRGVGMLNSVELRLERLGTKADRAARNADLRARCVRGGAYVRVDGQVWFIPPLTATTDELAALVDSVVAAADEWAG